MKKITEKFAAMMKKYGKEKMHRMEAVKEATEKQGTFFFVG